MNEFPYFKYQLSSKREIYICNPNIYNTNTVQFIYIYIYIRYIIENAIQKITNCIMRIGSATNVVILY